MKISHEKIVSKESPLVKELKEGIGYALRSPPIRSILLLLGLISLVGMPYTVLMPVFAKDVLKGGPHTLGYLMAASGAGALSGAIYLASRKSVLGLGRLIALAAGIFGVGLILFSFSQVLWLSLLLMLFTGFGMIVEMASSNTVLQTIVEDDKRGRVMSFYAMAFMGMAPLGSLLAGGLASQIGAPKTVLLGGICSIIGSVLFARGLPSLREIVRPIYIKKGIIPEVAKGIQTATELTVPPQE
jgi:MFS family permease